MTQKGKIRHLQRGPETPQAPVTPVSSYHTGWAEKLQKESSPAVEKRNQLWCPRIQVCNINSVQLGKETSQNPSKLSF